MRLFPPPWEGRHPAFPSEENENALPAPCSHPSISFAANTGLLGLVPLTIGTVFRLPRLRAFVFEATAFGAIIFSLCGLSTSRDKEQRVIRTFLDGQGVEVPSRKSIDRLGKCDGDDAVIMGAIGGLVLAHRSRTPSISGWKRHLGAAVFGAALGCVPLTLVTFVTLQASANDVSKDLIKKKLYRASWEATMLRNMLDRTDLSLQAGGIDVLVVAPSDPATLFAENGHDDGKKVLMAKVGERAIENDLLLGAKELRLLLLKGEMLDLAMTRTPAPSYFVRYLMYPLGSDAKEELEKYASTITQKREQAHSKQSSRGTT